MGALRWEPDDGPASRARAWGYEATKVVPMRGIREPSSERQRRCFAAGARCVPRPGLHGKLGSGSTNPDSHGCWVPRPLGGKMTPRHLLITFYSFRTECKLYHNQDNRCTSRRPRCSPCPFVSCRVLGSEKAKPPVRL